MESSFVGSQIYQNRASDVISLAMENPLFHSYQRDATSLPSHSSPPRFVLQLYALNVSRALTPTISRYLFNAKIKSERRGSLPLSLSLVSQRLAILRVCAWRIFPLLVKLPTDLRGLRTYQKFHRRSTIRPNWPRIL